jgi:hypothetical protein
MPGYWMHETSGTLKPAIMAYLDHAEMTPDQIALMRLYLGQWVWDGPWQGPNIDLLRATVGSLTTRKNIDSWLEVAEREGIDPL